MHDCKLNKQPRSVSTLLNGLIRWLVHSGGSRNFMSGGDFFCVKGSVNFSFLIALRQCKFNHKDQRRAGTGPVEKVYRVGKDRNFTG